MADQLFSLGRITMTTNLQGRVQEANPEGWEEGPEPSNEDFLFYRIWIPYPGGSAAITKRRSTSWPMMSVKVRFKLWYIRRSIQSAVYWLGTTTLAMLPSTLASMVFLSHV